MSSLWTPDGERPVPRPAPAAGGDSPAGAPGGGGSPGSPPDRSRPARDADEAGAEDADLAEQMAALRAELVNAPVEVVVANHCYGLFELAAVHLSQQPAMLEQARLAIDALGYLLDGLRGRLGDAEPQLKDGLSQLRLAYVQIDGAARAGAQVASASAANGGSAGETGPPPAESETGSDLSG